MVADWNICLPDKFTNFLVSKKKALFSMGWCMAYFMSIYEYFMSILHSVVKCQDAGIKVMMKDYGPHCVMQLLIIYCGDEKSYSFPQIGSFEQVVRRTV